MTPNDNISPDDENNSLPPSPEDNEDALTSHQDGDPREPEDNGDELRSFFADCFIQYASYVVRDRAIPDVDDGLKPVQRRILHCMRQVDDGRYNKVAGVVGDTMHYHPHGDASIGGALTVLANKEYFIDRQGNFGNILTGMPAAAPRYIECRLTELAKETLFNPEITEFVDTYDGRLKEPVRLPAKVPSLLMLGSDGIAVGMSTHIFPHNFGELLKAEISILLGEPFTILPDFPQGGLMDAREYGDGDGSIRVRAKIEEDGDKKLIIREVTPGTTTDSLIASIETAAKRGKVKIAAIHDYTAEHVCIEIALQRGIYAAETLKELYAYTECEKQLFSELRVIRDNMPCLMTVSDILRRNTEKLKSYLQRELELDNEHLLEKILEKTLAQIFVQYRIYKRIERSESVEDIMTVTRRGLEKYKHLYHRPITDDDITKVLQIPIRRISAFDIAKNESEIAELNARRDENNLHLAHLTDFTIDYIKHIYDKYAGNFPRRTQAAGFVSVDVKEVARRDIKVFFDKVNHFVGTNVKPSSKDAAPLELTEFDKITVFRTDGIAKVIDIPEREYVGTAKYIFQTDKEQIYSILYRDRVAGTWFAKRFKLGQFILGKEYHIIPQNCVIEQFFTKSGVVLALEIASKFRRSHKTIEVDFDSVALRSREAKGFKLTSYSVNNIKVVSKGSNSNPPDNSQDNSPDNPPESASESSDSDENRPLVQQSFFFDE